jgi:tetrapyrrole methylase family protein/MazG family protein
MSDTPGHGPEHPALTAAQDPAVARTARACGQLLAVLKQLRAPDGCPWDREQTAESLKPYMLEECHEVMAAIDGGNPMELREELGDLLLHALFQAEIAAEKGDFATAEPFEQIAEKLIRRHPHVFGEERLETPAEVERQWEALKLKEKGHQGESRSLLDGVPRTLPGLLRAQRIQEKMAGVGFDWADVSGARGKLQEEYGELCDALDRGDLEEARREFGDFLFSLVNLARFLKIHPEDSLRLTNDKVIRRFRHVEKRLREQGLDASDSDLATMDRFWDEAKALEGPGGQGPDPV